MSGTLRARSAGLVVRDLAEETLVYDIERHRVHCLTPLLANVWRACDGRRDCAAIARDVRRRSGVDVDPQVVAAALVRLRRARLVEGPSPPRHPLRSRRQALTDLAVLGGLTLVSLAAPTVAQAASCTPTGLCETLPNGQCTGLPCCEQPLVRCTKPNNGSRCACNA